MGTVEVSGGQLKGFLGSCLHFEYNCRIGQDRSLRHCCLHKEPHLLRKLILEWRRVGLPQCSLSHAAITQKLEICKELYNEIAGVNGCISRASKIKPVDNKDTIETN